jgi:hypothetical protein
MKGYIMQKFLSLKEIKKKVDEIYQRVLPKTIVPYITYNFAIGDATPNIEVNEHGYCFVISERGVEIERRITQDIQELMYWIFEYVTYNIASKYAVYNPYPSNWKQRRIRWKNQLELLGRISQDFKEKCKLEIMETLKNAPLEDGLPNNMDYETWEYPGKHENKHSTQIPSIDSLITQISTEDF